MTTDEESSKDLFGKIDDDQTSLSSQDDQPSDEEFSQKESLNITTGFSNE